MGDNMTYLSFHCFMQFYQFVPYCAGKNSYPSCILCLILLFVLILTVCLISFSAWIFAKDIFEVDYFKNYNSQSYLFFSLMIASKFCAGFFHSYIDHPLKRVAGLLGINCISLVILISCRKAV
jgi:hypothetical protein